MPTKPYCEAVSEALAIALERDPSVVVLGQGVDDPLAMFGCSRGLRERFGADRVFDTPVSEEAMTGVCVGAAMSGLRPVIMHNRPDFVLLCMNQLVNHAAKYSYMHNGLSRVPMVVWSAVGRGWGCGAQHAQALQGMLLTVPGLKIVMPSNPADSKGLLLSAIEDPNPVVFFEHRRLLKTGGEVPPGDHRVALGRAELRRRGEDLTIVASSVMVSLAEAALDRLAARGVRADLIDLRTIKPYDGAAVLDSVRRTGRLLVLDCGWQMAGVCAELVAFVAERAWSALRAPPRRLGMPDAPVPAGDVLEKAFYPDEERVSGEILALLGAPLTASR